jgi:hypothetical protein
VDLAEVKAKVVRSYRAWDARTPLRGVTYHEKSIGSVGSETGKIMYEYRIVASWQFMKATRTLSTLDASLNFLIPDADYAKLVRQYHDGADRRYWEMIKKAGVSKIVRGAIGSISEFALYEGASLRRQAQVFQGATSKIADLFAAVFRTMARFQFVLACFAVLVFIHQKDPTALSFLMHLHIVAWVINLVPRMDNEFWFLIFFAIAYCYRFFHKLHCRFSQKEVRIPVAGNAA